MGRLCELTGLEPALDPDAWILDLQLQAQGSTPRKNSEQPLPPLDLLWQR